MTRPRRAAVAVPTEHDEQVMFFRVIALHEPRYPELALVHAVPNGGWRSKATAGRLKAEGVRPGVPDIVAPIVRGTTPGMYLELKRLTGGRVSPEQQQWHARLMAQGYRVVVARGHAEAWAALCEYLSIPNTLTTGGSRAA